jgi:hypothetical protein
VVTTPNHSLRESPAPKTERTVVPLGFLPWLSLAVWAVSFFLPAVLEVQNWGGTNRLAGWGAAYDALVLFFVPVKGGFLSLEPHVFSGLANFFMLWAPFEIRRVRQSKGRVFTVLFLVVTAVAVGLVFLPHPEAVGIQGLLIGYYLWTFSLVAATAWFSWAVWRNSIGLLPSMILAGVTISAAFYHGLIERLMAR